MTLYLFLDFPFWGLYFGAESKLLLLGLVFLKFPLGLISAVGPNPTKSNRSASVKAWSTRS